MCLTELQPASVGTHAWAFWFIAACSNYHHFVIRLGIQVDHFQCCLRISKHSTSSKPSTISKHIWPAFASTAVLAVHDTFPKLSL